ncbi:MAG: major capsid protein [Microvirus sp.]|nr:MAG: major capsid protein [Microvirus sp.]
MKRNKFSLSHTKLFTHDLGELVPSMCLEVLPGDTIQHACSALVRASPLLSPVMHPVDVRIANYFVPTRLLWTNFADMITGGPAGVSLPVHPTVASPGGTGFVVGSLGDYLGIPTGVPTIPVSALPFRAYALIWNEFFRDQDLETPLVVSLADGVDSTTSLVLKNCAWEKDYLTSARPTEQKGPAISIPLGTSAPVVTSGAPLKVTNASASNVSLSTVGGAVTMTGGGSNATMTMGTPSGLQADLSTASAITVNALRQAMALQRYEENRSRYGSRYTEYLRFLGVKSSDARLQRPEYLGGGSQTIQFSEVLTTGTFGTEPVGALKGHGLSAMRSNRYRRFFEEHGFVISLMSVRPKTMYLNSLKRIWNRRAKEDYWQHELQHLGQQAVLNKEVYSAHTTPDGIFGYQDRYDEYRREESTVSGEFRSTLNFWHFGRSFGSNPALNASFVSCVPTEVPFALPSADVLWTMSKHSIQARRLVAPVGNSFIR